MTAKEGRSQSQADACVVDLWIWLILGLVVVRPFVDQFRDLDLGPFSITDLVVLGVIGTAIPPALSGGLPRPSGRVATLLATFIGVSLASGAVKLADQPLNDFPVTALRLVAVYVVFCVFFHLGIHRPRVVLPALGVSAVLPLVAAVAQIRSGVGTASNRYTAEESLSRVFGTFEHPNALAIFMALIVVVAGSHLVNDGTFFSARKAPWALLLLFAGIVIVPTYARSVWIAAPTALIVIGTLARRPVVPLAVVGLAVFGANSFAGSQVATRLSGFQSVSFRQQLWAALIDKFEPADVPFGLGLGQINVLVQRTTADLGLTSVVQVHNDYLRVVLESGLVGAFLYFGALALTALLAIRLLRAPGVDITRARLAKATLGAIVVVALVGFSDNIYQLPVLQFVVWALVGALNGTVVEAATDTADGMDSGAGLASDRQCGRARPTSRGETRCV